MPGILGRKIGMTRVFQENGTAVPVTLVECEPNTVSRRKTAEKDKYESVVLGFEPRKKASKTKKFHVSREFRKERGVSGLEELKPGDQVTVAAFKDVKEVTVTGVSKGKGFQGTMKRHHFHSGPGSHGSHFHREPGSVGPRAKMGKLHKGKRLAGRMGGDTVTVRKVPLIAVDAEKNILALKGQVPGPAGALVIIKS